MDRNKKKNYIRKDDRVELDGFFRKIHSNWPLVATLLVGYASV